MERLVRKVLADFFTVSTSENVGKQLFNELKNKKVEQSLDDVLLKKIAYELEGDLCDFVGDKETEYKYVSHILSYTSKPFYDFGSIKLAWCLSLILKYANSDKFSRLNNAHARFAAEKQIKIKDNNQYLTDVMNSRLAELKFIAEIGLWAKAKSKQSNEIDDSKPLVELAKTCELLINPLYNGSNILNLQELQNGRWLERVFNNHCFGGPYILRPPLGINTSWEAVDYLKKKRMDIEQIGRQLNLEHPGKVVVDVTGPIKVLSFPETRMILRRNGTPIFAEQFWVPKGNPESWSSTSMLEFL